MKRFAEVVDSCFGHNITCDYELKLYQFEEDFIQTCLPCSIKIYIICRHLVPYVKEYLPKNVCLGAVSEQATKSAHAIFKNIREKSYQCK